MLSSINMYHGEKFNSFTHLIGFLLALAGAVILLYYAALTENTYKIVSTAIYGTMMILLYGISTLYHSIRLPRAKGILQKLDHISIYLFIGGSYTPFTLITLQGSWGWWIFGINWLLALIGICCELTIAKKTRTPSLIIYIVMGWLIITAIKPLSIALNPRGLMLLALGGLLYTLGIVFFIFDEKIRHFHGIWHLFVLGGSISQYFCILLYLV